MRDNSLQMIPVLQFNARNLKSSVWRKWLAAIPKVRLEKQAKAHDQRLVEGSLSNPLVHGVHNCSLVFSES